MPFLLALTPILIILVLMVGFRWSAARAGSAGYLSALMIAIYAFGAGAQLLAYAHMKALLLTIDVLLIIWTAFLLYRVSDEAGAIRTISLALPLLTPDRGFQALIIGWVFASFLQSVGGFGVPVAVVAPILIGIGFSPISAVIIPSIGHSWSVTFGSMGSSFNALIAATRMPAETLAPPSALFLGISALLVGILVAHACGGWLTIRRLLLPVFIIGTTMAVIQYLVATQGPWNLSAFIATSTGLLIAIPLAYRQRGKTTEKNYFRIKPILIALSGYIVLIGLTLFIQLIPEIRSFLGKVELALSFPEVSTSLGYITPEGIGRKIPIFNHAGMVLFYTSIIAYIIYKFAGLYHAGAEKHILKGTVQRAMPSSVSIASMVAMAVIMEFSGMTNTLAHGLSESIGSFYPFAAPWIGTLGAFMTGSNTNSNVVFGALQMQTARILGFSMAIILAAQTAGGSLGSVIAPTKIIVGASTAGLANREGEIMGKLILYTAILILLISLLTIIFLAI